MENIKNVVSYTLTAHINVDIIIPATEDNIIGVRYYDIENPTRDDYEKMCAYKSECRDEANEIINKILNDIEKTYGLKLCISDEWVHKGELLCNGCCSR